jgi:hypothetical protein
MGDQTSGPAQTSPHAVKGVGEAVQDLANHVFGGLAPSGGKFTMNVDELNATIKQWNDLLAQLREDERAGRGLTRQVGPLSMRRTPLALPI